MSGDLKWPRDDARTLTRMADLTLSEGRLDQLAATLSAHLANFDRLREIDPGDREPPTITYEKEARS